MRLVLGSLAGALAALAACAPGAAYLVAKVGSGIVTVPEEIEGRCGECGGASFEIVNYADLELAGTVRVDGAGNVIVVEGILFCAACGEVFDPDTAAEPQDATRASPGHRPALRLIEGG